MPLYVPAHIEPLPQTVNHVLVEAGTNWDLSRTARVTPFVRVPDPEPVQAMPPPSHRQPSSLGRMGSHRDSHCWWFTLPTRVSLSTAPIGHPF